MKMHNPPRQNPSDPCWQQANVEPDEDGSPREIDPLASGRAVTLVLATSLVLIFIVGGVIVGLITP